MIQRHWLQNMDQENEWKQSQVERQSLWCCYSDGRNMNLLVWNLVCCFWVEQNIVLSVARAERYLECGFSAGRNMVVPVTGAESHQKWFGRNSAQLAVIDQMSMGQSQVFDERNQEECIPLGQRKLEHNAGLTGWGS